MLFRAGGALDAPALIGLALRLGVGAAAAVDRLDVLFRPGARLLDVVEHRGRVSVRGAPSALHTLSELAFLDMAVLLLPLCRGAQLDAVNLNHGGSPP